MLQLVHLPASSAPGAPLAAAWQLLPAGAGLCLDDAALQAAQAEAEAAGGAEADAMQAVPSGEQHPLAAAAPVPGPDVEAGQQAEEEACEFAAEAAAAAALPLAPALALKWSQLSNPPNAAVLRLLRPAAAAMLRALQARRGPQGRRGVQGRLRALGAGQPQRLLPSSPSLPPPW